MSDEQELIYNMEYESQIRESELKDRIAELKEKNDRLGEALLRLWAHVNLSDYPITKDVTRIVMAVLEDE